MKKRKGVKVVLLLILAVSTMILSMTVWQTIRQELEYSEARSEYADLRQQVVANTSGHSRASQTHNGFEHNKIEHEDIDFDSIFVINQETVGWIIIPGSSISYPIVQGNDNQHYLHHTFRGQSNSGGAIFLDHRDNSDLSDRARIYGHNMRDGSMFGSLQQWNGDTFTIYTPSEMLEFTVTWRGVLSLEDVMVITDDMILITCVNGDPNVRFVIRANTNH